MSDVLDWTESYQTSLILPRRVLGVTSWGCFLGLDDALGRDSDTLRNPA
jgi:hypothetical protein